MNDLDLKMFNYSKEIIDSTRDLFLDTSDKIQSPKVWWHLFKEIFFNLYEIFYKLSSVSVNCYLVERSFSI